MLSHEDNVIAMQTTQATPGFRPLCWFYSISIQNIAPSAKAILFGKGRYRKSFGLKTGGKLGYGALRTLPGWTQAKEALWLFHCMPENDPVTGIKSITEVQAKHEDWFYGCFSGPLNWSIKPPAFLLGLKMRLISQAGQPSGAIAYRWKTSMQHEVEEK